MVILLWKKLYNIIIKIERSINSIKKTLEFESEYAKEFDYHTWINEEIMWK